MFRAGPMVGLAAVLGALAVVPLAGAPALLSFGGDLILLAYFLGLMRFFTVLAALDTGSAFEGMGASREVQFSALAEPALLLGLAALVQHTVGISLSEIFGEAGTTALMSAGPALFLVAAALVIVFLAENARIPVDDPNTHLELTMIHEVMVLDHGGPDFALILYGAALKMWVLGALIVGIVLPVRSGSMLAGPRRGGGRHVRPGGGGRAGRVEHGAAAPAARAAAAVGRRGALGAGADPGAEVAK